MARQLFAWEVTAVGRFSVPRRTASRAIFVISEGGEFNALHREMESLGLRTDDVESVKGLGPIANTDFYARQADCAVPEEDSRGLSKLSLKPLKQDG